MPRSSHSARKTQSLYISNGGVGTGGGVRTTSPDILLSSDYLNSTPPHHSSSHSHYFTHAAPISQPQSPRPHSLHAADPTTHPATYLYSCNPPYARYYGNLCGGVSSSNSIGITSGIRMREVNASESSEDCSSQGVEGCTRRGSTGGQDELFHSPRHAEVALRRMEEYYARGQLCDVTLVAGGRRIHAHRLVLCAASDYFAAMFTSPVLEASQEEVSLRDMDAEALLTLVNYCYTGSLELHEDTVEVVLSTAHHLLLTEVVNVCCEFLTKQLHPANCLGIQLFADTQGCSDLHRLASKYTAEHFQEVMQHHEFVQLPPDEAARLLASDDLNVPSEELIFQALVLWLKHDLEGRTKEMARLLALVKLPLLSPQFLTDHIETNALFREDRACQELVMEALKYHLLPERRSTLQSPRTHPRKSTVGDLYVVGGMDANKGSTGIEIYNLRTDTWQSAGAMTGRRLQCGVAVVEGRLLVIGGRDGLKTLNTAEAWDPTTQAWTPLPPMSTHRHGLGVGVLGGPLYAVGGHDGWSYLNTVERWDPQARQWSYVAPMSTPRSTVGVAVLGSRLYAVGGRDGSSCLRTVESYDPHTNKWTACAPMARRRGGVGVGVLNGFLYAVGGHDAPASNPCASRFDCVERYDPATDTWTQVACLSVGCDSAGVSPLGGRLVAVAGYDGQTYLGNVHAYDPHTNEWSELAPLPTGRAGACVVVVGSQQQ